MRFRNAHVEMLLARALEEGLTAAEAERMRRHLVVCAGCGQLAEALKRNDDLLLTAVRVPQRPPLDIPARTDSRVQLPRVIVGLVCAAMLIIIGLQVPAWRSRLQSELTNGAASADKPAVVPQAAWARDTFARGDVVARIARRMATTASTTTLAPPQLGQVSVERITFPDPATRSVWVYTFATHSDEEAAVGPATKSQWNGSTSFVKAGNVLMVVTADTPATATRIVSALLAITRVDAIDAAARSVGLSHLRRIETRLTTAVDAATVIPSSTTLRDLGAAAPVFVTATAGEVNTPNGVVGWRVEVRSQATGQLVAERDAVVGMWPEQFDHLNDQGGSGYADAPLLGEARINGEVRDFHRMEQAGTLPNTGNPPGSALVSGARVILHPLEIETRSDPDGQFWFRPIPVDASSKGHFRWVSVTVITPDSGTFTARDLPLYVEQVSTVQAWLRPEAWTETVGPPVSEQTTGTSFCAP